MGLEDLVMFVLKATLWIAGIIWSGSPDYALVVTVVVGFVSFCFSFHDTWAYLRVLVDSETEYEAHIADHNKFQVKGRLNDLPLKWLRHLRRVIPCLRAPARARAPPDL